MVDDLPALGLRGVIGSRKSTGLANAHPVIGGHAKVWAMHADGDGSIQVQDALLACVLGMYPDDPHAGTMCSQELLVIEIVTSIMFR